MASNASAIALDPRGLDRLRSGASAAPEKSVREAAKQFETLFINQLLESMRDATPNDGILDSEQTKMYTGMLDQQLAQTMANKGIGLAAVMVKQLSKGSGSAAAQAAGVTAPALNLTPGAPRNQQVPAAAPTGAAGMTSAAGAAAAGAC